MCKKTDQQSFEISQLRHFGNNDSNSHIITTVKGTTRTNYSRDYYSQENRLVIRNYDGKPVDRIGV